jgi:endonuclease YncB( thermonuclease family)
MVTLFSWLVWTVLFVATPASSSSVEQPPALPLPDLSLAPVVKVLDTQGGDGLVVQRPDNSYLTVRLAGVVVDQADSARRHMAWAFLHNLLAGERVWLVRADPSKQANTDKYYVYRWPDRLLANLEMVRQGYSDTMHDKTTPQAVVKAFTYWCDQARLYRKGTWSVEPQAAASAPAAPAPASGPVATVAADKTIVYVGASGKKYHLANCKALHSTRTPMKLEDARRSYEPCKQCNPPK